MIELTLPYPPSANHYWRYVRGRVLLSRGGRRYRQEVVALLAAAGVRPLCGNLAVVIEVYPPDRRARDLDNVQKSLLDSLEHGGAFHNDAQIVWLLTFKARVVPGGQVIVRIAERPCQDAGFPIPACLNLN